MGVRFIQRLRRMSPFVLLTAGVLAGLVVAAGAWLLFRDKTQASSNVEPYAARIERVDGDVGIARIDQLTSSEDEGWTNASINAPVAVGDRVYAREGSRASIALTGHNFVRLEPEAALDVLSLTDDQTQLALRNGAALFDIGALDSGDLCEVGTPYGAVDFLEPGLYQIGIENGTALISVLNGVAQVVGRDGSGRIGKGEVLSLVAEAATQVLASRLAPNLAGGIVDDYYRYRFPARYDGRYSDYNTYLSDPYYFDPYRTSESCRYLPADVPGIYDLDGYGDWVEIDGYGRCWAPRATADWAPFRSGYWDFDQLWGATWISNEPWGWAPYHYGRWTYTNQRWYWVPQEVVARRAYCAAPVAFIPVSQRSEIGWVPLAPGEPYVARYYDVDYQPRFLTSPRNWRRREFANLNVVSGLTVVPIRYLGRRIDPSIVERVDAKSLARDQIVVDPLEVQSIRQAALTNQESRRQFRIERRNRELLNQPVVTTSTPTLPPSQGLARALQFQQVPDAGRKKKLKIEQTGQTVNSRGQFGLPRVAAPGSNANEAARQQQMNELSARAAQGDKAARKELKRLRKEGNQPAGANNQVAQQTASDREQLHQQMKEQQKQQRQQQAEAAAQQQAQQRQAREQRKQQKRLERQQQSAAPQQKQPPQQTKQERKERKRAEKQRNSRPPAQQQLQQQRVQQSSQQKRLERAQQAAAQRSAQQAQVRAQQRAQQQHKEQKRLERQQQAAAAQRQQQQNQQVQEQRKQQKQFERQRQAAAAAQQEAARRAQQQIQQQAQQQRKDQKRDERLQQQAQEQQKPKKHKPPDGGSN